MILGGLRNILDKLKKFCFKITCNFCNSSISITLQFTIVLFFHKFLDIVPNLGDVRLYNITTQHDMIMGEAQVFISNGRAPSNWSKICNLNPNSNTIKFDGYESSTFCRQLGYSNGQITSKSEMYD